MDKKVAVISGGSRGIGLETVKLFAAQGYKVYELSRNGADGVAIHIACDLSQEQSVVQAVERIIKDENRIDILVCNAGYGISGALEFTDISQAKAQFDVNFFGNLTLIKAVLPVMRSRKRGNIIMISSVAAVFAIPFQSFYSCSKAAINAACFALANEVRPFGINVAAVMPGDVKTSFTEYREKKREGGEVYSSMEKSIEKMEKDEQNGAPPDTIARFVLKLAQKKKLKPLYTVGASYKLFVFLSKLLPASLYNKIVGKMYS